MNSSIHRGVSPTQDHHGAPRPDVPRTGATFSHVALAVSDLERSLAFYRDGLSCDEGHVYHAAGGRVASLMGIPPSGFRGVFLRCGQAYIELLEYAEMPKPTTLQRDPRDVGYAHMSLIVPDIDRVATVLVAHGGTVLSELRHAFGGAAHTHIAFVADPDGNRVELISHPDLAEERAHAEFHGCEHLRWPVIVQG